MTELIVRVTLLLRVVLVPSVALNTIVLVPKKFKAGARLTIPLVIETEILSVSVYE